jgi:hypothetical protein
LRNRRYCQTDQQQDERSDRRRQPRAGAAHLHIDDRLTDHRAPGDAAVETFNHSLMHFPMIPRDEFVGKSTNGSGAIAC